MAAKSWHLDRRTFLMGTGVSLGLPWLDCMGAEGSPQEIRPRRVGAFYFGFGVGLPAEDDEASNWRWFPKGSGTDYEFTDTLKPLEKVRKHLSVLGGLSHPNGRKMGGHDTGDTFLTGALMNRDSLANSVSFDQVIAEELASQTRFPSMVLSTDGGVGEPTRSSTLSYDRRGRPIPAINQPQQVFDRFFGLGDADSQAEQRELQSTSEMVDRILGDSKDLKRKLGKGDQRKLDEYLQAVREIERRVQRSQHWLEIPRPKLNDDDRDRLELDADDQAPRQFISTMYDLIYLAFRTDTTRVATYQITNMADASSKAGKFPQLIGFKDSLHTLAHGWNKPGGAEQLGKWDRFMAEQFGNFIGRLAAADERDGSVLDHTLLLYGSSNSNTHNNRNYPLLFAGGTGLGIRQGRYLTFEESVPLSNLLLTMMDRAGARCESFADSNGHIPELLSV